MKKLLGAVAGLWAGVAFAGDYHLASTLRCSECHTMHASRSHGLNQQAFEPTFIDIGVAATPNRNLLLQDGTNATCLACHDNNINYPDVLGTDGGMVGGGLRSAGALNADALSGFTAGAGYDHFDGHTLGSDDVPPGWVGAYEPTPQENFNCANCHAVHGSAAFRNLGLSRFLGFPGWSGTVGNAFETAGPAYNIQNVFIDGSPGRRAAAATDDVFVEGDPRTYDARNVIFKKGTGGMNKYCAVCHGNFHGDANTRDLIGGQDFIRHPTSGIERDPTSGVPLLNFGAQAAQIDLVRPAWVAAGAVENGNFEAACLSCHKGHGNQNGYGLIYPDNTGAAVNFEDGDAAAGNDTLRNLCITCHAQGRELLDPTMH
jgi:hypothetical protein